MDPATLLAFSKDFGLPLVILAGILWLVLRGEVATGKTYKERQADIARLQQELAKEREVHRDDVLRMDASYKDLVVRVAPLLKNEGVKEE